MATQAQRTGTIMDVGHIVILMQENRSFDHYFGTMRGVRGFGDRFTVPVRPSPANPDGSVWLQRNDNPGAPHALVAPFHLDTAASFSFMRVAGTPHLWPNAQRAWNNGVMDAWPTFKQDHAMAYYTQADIPFQFALADMFTVCDAYHCSFQGGTNPNRVFAWTGANDGLGQGGGPVIGNSYDKLTHDPAGGYAWTTYPERLQAAGVSWQVYQDMADNYTDNPLAGFRRFRDAHAGIPGADPQLRERALSTRTLAHLRQDVQDDRLPQVSFIVATAQGSEHPVPSSPAQGAEYTAAVLEALASNPAVWSKTVLFLMFDENDGFFDHAPPPAPPAWQRRPAGPEPGELAGASTVSTAGEYPELATSEATDDPALLHRPYGLGPRVPMYVISPWSRGGWVKSQVFDHTSVIRFVERRFGVMEPNISPWRRAVCGDLTSAFNFALHDDSPFFAALPDPAPLARRARALDGAALPLAPGSLGLPMQAGGVRPSRALPYALDVSDRLSLDGASVTLLFANGGAQAAVFHVYDKTQPGSTPRRYTVEAGKELSGSWTPASAGGAYDLWVLAPNGFHRRFAGRTSVGLHGALPQVRIVPDAGGPSVTLRLRNWGLAPATFTVAAGPYGSGEQTVSVASNDKAALAFDLGQTGGWHDLSVRLAESPAFLRRFAGRIETGRDGVSDPAMGGLARSA